MTEPALVIVQARMGSSRFPGKSLAEIEGRPILWYLFRQLSFCGVPILPILATTDQPLDDPLAAYAHSQGWKVFRGSEGDVLARYHDAALAFGATDKTVIVRVTGDDIFPDPHLIDAAMSLHESFRGLVDCVLTAEDGNLPYGAYVESYTFRALEKAHREAVDPADREHVSLYIKRNRDTFPRVEISVSRPLGGLPLSIDSSLGLQRAKATLSALGDHPLLLSDVAQANMALFGRLAGSKVNLERPDVRFAADIFAYGRDPEFTRYLDSSPFTQESEAGELLGLFAKENEAGLRDYWVIVEQESGRAIGTIGFLLSIDGNGHAVEMGYGLARDRWGLGLFTESAELLLRYGFERLALSQIEVITRADNKRSIRAVERLGFRFVEHLHGHYKTCEGLKDGVRLAIEKGSVTQSYGAG